MLWTPQGEGMRAGSARQVTEDHPSRDEGQCNLHHTTQLKKGTRCKKMQLKTHTEDSTFRALWKRVPPEGGEREASLPTFFWDVSL